MGTPQGGYPIPPSAPSAPSAPPAPSSYQSQQSWQQPNYSSVPSTYSSTPPSYSSAPPSLSYSNSLRYNSQNSFSASHPPTASPYADPAQVNSTYGQSPNTYGQASYGQTQVPQSPYADPSKLISTYGQAPVPSTYGQPAQPSSYGQPVPPSSYGQPQPTSYGQSQPTSYGKPACQQTGYPVSQYGQTYGQPTQYSTAGSYPPTAYGNPYGQNYQVGKPKVQFPAGTDPEIIRAFELGDIDGSGFIDAAELGRVLSAGLPFSLRTVHLMLHLYGTNGTKIGPTEFMTLWKSLKDWKASFERFDKDRSGRIDFQELRDGLLSMGYAISPPILQILISKYDRTGQAKALDYDNFVECGLVVKGLTDRFKAKDTRFTGSATLDYETFMQMVLPFIVA